MTKRRLILTPFDEGCFFGLESHINSKEIWGEDISPIDITNVYASAITMAGLSTLETFSHTSDKNILLKNANNSDLQKWISSNEKVSLYFNQILPEGSLESNSELNYLVYKLGNLFFAMETNFFNVTIPRTYEQQYTFAI